MTKFSEVFSITWKVVIALAIISAATAIVVSVFKGMESSPAVDSTRVSTAHIDVYAKKADESLHQCPEASGTKR